MSGLFDSSTENAKIMFLGDSGHWKTGAKAALIAEGYKLRMIDTDNGAKVLRSLLTDPRYPYANYIKKKGIDLAEPGRISIIPIEVPIGFTDVSRKQNNRTINYSVLSPTSARAWSTVIKMLQEWIDDGVSYGGIADWGNDVILDFDTLTTLGELAKYWVQDMNGRLGALEDEHGRDTGAGQELLRRLMMKLTSPSAKCNVICTTHVNWVDQTRHVPLNPGQLLREGKGSDPRGFPAALGNALSPYLPKRWNDQFIARRVNSEYRIYATSVDNIDAKHSAWTEDWYPASTGLAEIFAALRYQPPPINLINAVRPGTPITRNSNSGEENLGSSSGSSSQNKPGGSSTGFGL